MDHGYILFLLQCSVLGLPLLQPEHMLGFAFRVGKNFPQL